MNKELDETDIAIIRALQEDARLSVRELASRVHRSPTPVFERLRRLEEEKVIIGYSALIDADRLGRGFTVFCCVKLQSISTECHLDFTRQVELMDEVLECYNVSGTYDYLLKVQVPGMKVYREFITDRLGTLEMIDSVQSMFVMGDIKHSTGLV